MVGVPAPLQQPTGLLQPGGTQSAGQGLFESHLAKLAIKTENSTPQGAAFGADGGSRTHATVSCPKAFRVLSSIPQLTEFAGKKRKLSEDDSTAKRRKKSKNELFLTSKRRNSNPFQNADFSGKMREKQAFLVRWRDVGEKSRREQNGLIFLITTGIYGIVLTDFYAKIPLSKKSNRPLPAVDEFK